MNPDDLDRVLSTDESIAPSSGFVSSVMELVEREAVTPPPIPFPWVRLAVGLVVVFALGAVLTWAGVPEALLKSLVSLSQLTAGLVPTDALRSASHMATMWAAGALLVALASYAVSFRLVRPR